MAQGEAGEGVQGRDGEPSGEERLWLEGVTGSLDLRFHADTDAVPERERAAGLPHNGQKR